MMVWRSAGKGCSLRLQIRAVYGFYTRNHHNDFGNVPCVWALGPSGRSMVIAVGHVVLRRIATLAPSLYITFRRNDSASDARIPPTMTFLHTSLQADIVA